MTANGMQMLDRYSDALMDIIDHAHDMPRGDLQSAVEAQVAKIIKECKNN